jgi:hypothetical protein
MTRHSTAERPSPLLAAAVVLASVGVVAAVYWTMYTTSADELARARAAHAQIAWVAAAEPDWRKEYARRLEALKVGSGFFVATKPQEAASEFQSRLRQALAGAGASVDSLQSSTTAPIEGKLPVIRAVATARIAAAQTIDVLQAVEAIQPRVALESVDIAIQTTGSPQAPERIALITIAARAYVMVSEDAVN